MRYRVARLAMVSALALAASCGDEAGGPSAFTGRFRLDVVDGEDLPFPISSSLVGTLSLKAGTLDFDPEGVEDSLTFAVFTDVQVTDDDVRREFSEVERRGDTLLVFRARIPIGYADTAIVSADGDTLQLRARRIGTHGVPAVLTYLRTTP